MQPYQQAHLNTVLIPGSIIDCLNSLLTYIEFFKSSMTDNELLTAIQDQMDKYGISKQFINNLYDISIMGYHNLGPVTLASVKLYEIITELEDKCKSDITNKQQ